MATKLKVNYEFVGDSTTPVTRTESIKHGDNMLSSVITSAVTALGNKADKSYVDSQDALKANKTYVDTELAKKANAADVTSGLATKADNTTVSAIASRVSTNETNIATQTARIDEIAALPEGSTTGDAELMDIRVGADSVTYTSAGAAVRSQITDLKSDLNNLSSVTAKKSKNLLPISKVEKTVNNVDYVYEDGKITVDGTVSVSGGRRIRLCDEFVLQSGTYTVWSTQYLNIPIVLEKVNGDDADIIAVISNVGITFTLNKAETLFIGCNAVADNTYSGSTNIQIEKGNYKTIYESPSHLENACQDDIDNIKNGHWIDNSCVMVDGGYVSNTNKQIVSHQDFSYSNLIELQRSEKVKVTGAYSNTKTVVDMLSKWTSDGNYMSSIYAYSKTNEYTEYEYTATDEIEYIRICTMTSKKNQLEFQKKSKGIDEISENISSIENEVHNIENHIDLSFASLSMFKNIGFCGDSYVKGSLYNENGFAGDFPDLSWGSCIGRLNGITSHIFARGGANTEIWQTDENCLPNLLNSQKCELYIFCLGINDYTTITKGSISDITNYSSYSEYPNTFYGNYGKIIEQVIGYSPNSKIIIMTPYYSTSSGYYEKFKVAIEEITNHYGIAMIDTVNSKIVNTPYFGKWSKGGHPTAVLHSAMAKDITKLINGCIEEYENYFKYFTGV